MEPGNPLVLGTFEHGADMDVAGRTWSLRDPLLTPSTPFVRHGGSARPLPSHHRPAGREFVPVTTKESVPFLASAQVRPRAHSMAERCHRPRNPAAPSGCVSRAAKRATPSRTIAASGAILASVRDILRLAGIVNRRDSRARSAARAAPSQPARRHCSGPGSTSRTAGTALGRRFAPDGAPRRGTACWWGAVCALGLWAGSGRHGGKIWTRPLSKRAGYVLTGLVAGRFSAAPVRKSNLDPCIQHSIVRSATSPSDRGTAAWVHSSCTA